MLGRLTLHRHAAYKVFGFYERVGIVFELGLTTQRAEMEYFAIMRMGVLLSLGANSHPANWIALDLMR
jgi:hypothetical protein